jgi:hypothetical protein
MGGSAAETIRQPRDRLKGQPQEGQQRHPMFTARGTRDRLFVVRRMKQRLSAVAREFCSRSWRPPCFHKLCNDKPGAATGGNAHCIGVDGEPLRNHRHGKYKGNNNRARCNDVHRINPKVRLALAPVLFRLLSKSKRDQIVVVVFTVRHNFHLGTRDIEHGSIVLNTAQSPKAQNCYSKEGDRHFFFRDRRRALRSTACVRARRLSQVAYV